MTTSGNTPFYTRWISGVFYYIKRSGHATIFSIDGANRKVAFDKAATVQAGGAEINTMVRQLRTRFTVAQVNAGASLLAAPGSGLKYRMIAAKCIAIGGNAATGTTVDILGTQSTSSVKLAAFAQASLTQSAVLTAGGSGAAVLADGASFVACDENTAITVGKTGSNFATATHFDVIFEYAIDIV